MIDWEKADKLPQEHRYFNISVLWIFYYRWALRLFYVLKIPHEIITIMAIGTGLVSAYFFYVGQLLPAAILLHFKDIFDACDGALARLTRRGHLIGRYLDSMGDFLVLTAVMIAICIRAAGVMGDWRVFWIALGVLSIFLQCSFFNYYQLAYLEIHGINRLSSRQDEISRDDIDRSQFNAMGIIILKMLWLFYVVIYGWQDKLVKLVDKRLFQGNRGQSRTAWYGNKKYMVMLSPLCFGTHIFVIIVFAIIGKPIYSPVFIGTVMNIYLLYLLRYRKIAPKG